MSTLRERREAIRQEGEARRGTKPIDPNSFDCKVYNWWLTQGGEPPTRENFCHYWRVVLVWAPLRWLKPFVFPAFVALLLVAAVASLVLAAVKLPNARVGLGVLVVFAAAFAYIATGVRTAWHVLGLIFDDDDARWKWLDRRGSLMWVVAVVLTIPVCLAVWVFVGVIRGLGVLLTWLHEEKDIFRRSARWFFRSHPTRPSQLRWMAPWMVPAAAILALLLWWDYQVVILIAVSVALAFGVLMLSAWRAEVRKERRHARVEHARELKNFLQAQLVDQRMYRLSRRETFEKWLSHYEVYWLRTRGQSLWASSVADHSPEAMKAWREQQRAMGKKPAAYKLRTRRQRFLRLRAVGRATSDILALIWTVVVVKKWKICSFVDVPRI